MESAANGKAGKKRGVELSLKRSLVEGGHFLHTYQSDTTIQPWYPSTPFTSTSTTRADYPVHPLANQFTRLQQTGGGGGPPQAIDHRRTESQSTAHASYSHPPSAGSV